MKKIIRLERRVRAQDIIIWEKDETICMRDKTICKKDNMIMSLMEQGESFGNNYDRAHVARVSLENGRSGSGKKRKRKRVG